MITTDKGRRFITCIRFFDEKHTCVPSLIAPHSSSSPPRGAIRELRCPSGWLEVRGGILRSTLNVCLANVVWCGVCMRASVSVKVT